MKAWKINVRGLKGISLLPLLVRGSIQFDQLREQQAHVPTFVHDQGMAKGTRDLGGHLILLRIARGRVKRQITAASSEIDILFVKDGRPLERRPVHDLTAATVTEFRIDGLFSTDGEGDLSTLAFGAPLDRAKFLVTHASVGSTVFPGLLLEGVFVVVVGEGGCGERILSQGTPHFGHDDGESEGERLFR